MLPRALILSFSLLSGKTINLVVSWARASVATLCAYAPISVFKTIFHYYSILIQYKNKLLPPRYHFYRKG